MTVFYCQNGRIGRRNSKFPPNIFLLSEGSLLEPVATPDYEYIEKLEIWPLDLAIKAIHGVAGEICKDFKFDTGFGSKFSFNQVQEIAMQAIQSENLKAKKVEEDYVVEPRIWIHWFEKKILGPNGVMPNELKRISNDKQFKTRETDLLYASEIKEKVRNLAIRLKEENPKLTKSALSEHPEIKKIALRQDSKPYEAGTVYKWLEDLPVSRGRPRK